MADIIAPVTANISYRQEVYRKLIHVSSLWIPALIYALPRVQAASIFVACTAAVLAGEFLRTRNYPISHFIRRLFQPMLRGKEMGARFRLTGASFTVIAALVATVLFPREIAVTVLSIMIVADAMAALIGRKWGKTPILDKSVQGSAAFLVAALACVFTLNGLFDYPERYMTAGIAAALTATVVELFSSRIHFDDNLAIPLISGLAMWAVMSLS